jgi:hypothetical protein
MVSVVNKETSVFYIIYLFWCDEFLRTFFDRLKLRFNRSQIQDTNLFRSNVKSRSFMLFVYFVFIFIVFGLVMNSRDADLVLLNFEVLLFQNALFNATLVSFLLREIYLFMNPKSEIESQYLLSNGIVILHLSIILGIFAWFLSTQKFLFFAQYATILSILPFLILKLFFELKLGRKTDKE